MMISLPKPDLDNDYPLIKSIINRRTKRKWSEQIPTNQEVSNICFVACGETKKATKRSKNRRTIPSGCNAQIVRLYVALDTGLYKYLEDEHSLELISEKDIRQIIGTQKMMKSAPLGLLYVADYNQRSGIMKPDQSHKKVLAATEVGAMSQNVYLYSAASNLNTVLIALFNKGLLHKELCLSDNQEIIYTQIVGKEL